MHGQLGGLLLQLPAPLHPAALSQQPDVRPASGHRSAEPLPAGGFGLHLHHVLLHSESHSHNPTGSLPKPFQTLVGKYPSIINECIFYL